MRFYLAMLWLLLLVGFKCAQKERAEPIKYEADSHTFNGNLGDASPANTFTFDSSYTPLPNDIVASTLEGVDVKTYKIDGLEQWDGKTGLSMSQSSLAERLIKLSKQLDEMERRSNKTDAILKQLNKIVDEMIERNKRASGGDIRFDPIDAYMDDTTTIIKN